MSKIRTTDRTIKSQMIELSGTRCMCCKQYVGKYITWHHLKPRYAGGQDTLSNASLLCANCHVHLHKYAWGEPEYERLTRIILRNRAEFTGREDLNREFSFNWLRSIFLLLFYICRVCELVSGLSWKQLTWEGFRVRAPGSAPKRRLYNEWFY